MTTYSLGITGIRNDYVDPYDVATLDVPDTDAGGNCLRDGTIAVSGMNTMAGTALVQRLGSQVLCKNPDGSQSWYTIDAERSIPGVSLVMIPV